MILGELQASPLPRLSLGDARIAGHAGGSARRRHQWRRGRATGWITADDNTTARQRLNEATVILVGHGVTYTDEVPATHGKIWAYQLQQIRDGVR
jgi:hypothetical protein